MKTYKIIPFIFLLLLSGLAVAQTVTIGVQPSTVTVDFNKASSYRIEYLFFNDKGDTDAVYLLKTDCPSIVNLPSEINVPKGTSRTVNPVKLWVTMNPDFTGNKECNIRISVKTSGSGNLKISPEVAAKINVLQPAQNTNYNPSQQSGVLLSSNLPTTTTTPAIFAQTNPEKKTTSTTQANTSSNANEAKSGFPFTTLILIGSVIAICVIGYVFRDYIIDFVTVSIPVFLLLSAQLASAVDVDVNVTVVPPLPVPTGRFFMAFPLGGLLVAFLVPTAFVLALMKLMMDEKFELTPSGFMSVIIIFTMLIIFAVGLAYVFMSL
jgi:hypothetical protein